MHSHFVLFTKRYAVRRATAFISIAAHARAISESRRPTDGHPRGTGTCGTPEQAS